VSVTFNEDSDLQYEIKIYLDLSDPSDPKSGILADTITGATTYAGTYTISLNSEVTLSKGSYFSVIVSVPSGSVGIAAEYSYKYRNSSNSVCLVSKAGIEKNQSFIYYNNNWRDLSDLGTRVGNLCIKAFTNSTSTAIEKTKLLKKIKVTKSSTKLIWTKTIGATGYEIYRSKKNKGKYKKIATVKRCSYTNKNLTSNTTYYYKVRAYKKSGKSKSYGKFSKIIKIKTKK
jgi:hypothetical protein